MWTASTRNSPADVVSTVIVKVKFEPMDANGEETYSFESTVVGGAIPKEYIPAVDEGIQDAMKAGVLEDSR